MLKLVRVTWYRTCPCCNPGRVFFGRGGFVGSTAKSGLGQFSKPRLLPWSSLRLRPATAACLVLSREGRDGSTSAGLWRSLRALCWIASRSLRYPSVAAPKQTRLAYSILDHTKVLYGRRRPWWCHHPVGGQPFINEIHHFHHHHARTIKNNVHDTLILHMSSWQVNTLALCLGSL